MGRARGMRSSASKMPTIYYGWWLVVVSLLFMSIGVGASLYLYSVIAGAIAESIPSDRLLLMSGATGLLLTLSILSPTIGKLLDRFPIKWTISGGAIVMGVGYICLSFCTSIWQVILCYTLLIGVGLASLSPLTASALLSRWFLQHRGLALGIAGVGTQFGGLVYPPIVASAVAFSDWRATTAGLGVFIIVSVTILAWLTVTDYPRQKGLSIDGSRYVEAPQHDMAQAYAPLPPKISLISLYTQPTFLLVVIILGGAGAVCTAVISNVALFAGEIGAGSKGGAYLVSVLAATGAISSPLIGRLCDVWNVRVVASGVFIISALGMILFLGADSYPMLLVATVLQGFVIGGHIPLWGSLIGKIYHSSILGQVLGASVLGMSALTAVTPSLSGLVFDLADSYKPFFLIMLGIMLLATVLLFILSIPNEEEKLGCPKM